MKKAFGLLVAVMALVMALSSCTPNGAPLTMVGKWSFDYGCIEVTDKDDVYYGLTTSTMQKVGTITKCTCDEVTLDTSWIKGTWKYEISGNSMTLTNDSTKYEFSKIND